MYSAIGISGLVIGAALFAFAKKIAGRHRVLMICVRIFGIIFIIAGLAALYLLLSGKVVLPLF